MAIKPLVAGAVAALAALAAPALAQQSAAVTEAQFRAATAADLGALCGVSAQDPNRVAAIHLCHGFLLGAGQYHSAVTAPGGGQRPVYCVDAANRPTIDQASTAFATWIRANPQHAGENAIDGLSRWAAATYPCPAAPARPRGR